MEAGGERRPNPGRIVELRVADDPQAWAAAGFAVHGDRVRLGQVGIRLTGEPAEGRRGITGWTLSGLAISDGRLDGLPTQTADPVGPTGTSGTSGTTDPSDRTDAAPHPNGAVAIDHVVVATPDLDRTLAACEAAGLELRRIRETTSMGSPMRQAFFKLGPVVLEVVSGDTGSGLPATDAPATFFGLAVDVDDLDTTAARLGPGLGRIKGAVQRGRRIATIRHRDLGLSVAIAAMDDHADRIEAEDDR